MTWSLTNLNPRYMLLMSTEYTLFTVDPSVLQQGFKLPFATRMGMKPVREITQTTDICIYTGYITRRKKFKTQIVLSSIPQKMNTTKTVHFYVQLEINYY